MVCPLHGYNEMSARHKLERHRKRGDYTQIMLYHDECGQWHVFARPDDPPLEDELGLERTED